MDNVVTMREREARLLDRCAEAGTSGAEPVNAEEASVFGLAAQLVEIWHPKAGAALYATSKRYFAGHGTTPPHDAANLVHRGVIADLPRFRSMLIQKLRGRQTW